MPLYGGLAPFNNICMTTYTVQVCFKNWKLRPIMASGYDYSFLEQPDYEHCCPICLLVLRDPHLTECCGNHFCQICVQRVTSMECPLCKTPKFTTVLDKFFLRKIHALKLYCPQQSNGCPWIGELGEVERHLDPASSQCTATCPCKFGCGNRLLMPLLPRHHEECERRPYRCQYCNTFTGIYADVVRDHFPVCPKYPVPCPKRCGAKKIKRASLKKHLTKCPMSLVDCKYKDAGCLAKVRRKDTSSHYSEYMSEHLEMAHSAFLRLSDESQRERDCLTAEIEVLKLKLANAEAELFSNAASFQQREGGEIMRNVIQIQSMEAVPKALDSQIPEHVNSKELLHQGRNDDFRSGEWKQSVAIREKQLHAQATTTKQAKYQHRVKEQEPNCNIM